jgi:hypothetical protein
VERFIGDYYGSYMDEARVNKLGLCSGQAVLAEIDAMNLPTFQRAFSCKDGSAMVRPPADRCTVW